MTIWSSGAKLLKQAIQAIALTRWTLAVAIIGTGFASLTVAGKVREAAAPAERIRSSPIIKPIGPPSAESAHAADSASVPQPSSPVLSAATFRFGFLEFEDDADAPPR